MPLRTLLIGGSGFLGVALLSTLLATGRSLTVLGRSPVPRYPLPMGVSYVQGDAGNQTLIGQLISASDEVVDLAYATVPQTSFIDPLFDVVANLPTAVNALQIASKAKLRRYLLVSSGGTVYGNTDAETLDENSPTHPLSPYGISKLVAEKYALFFHQMENLPVVIARPGNPYGPLQLGRTVQGFVGAAMTAIRRQQSPVVYGARGTVRDYLHVDDVAYGLGALLQNGRVGSVYNLGSGVGHDNLDIIERLRPLAEQEGLGVQISYQPDRPFDVRRNVLDSRLAFQDTGWKVTIPLEEGLSRLWHISRDI